jgi:two-component system, response regulator PdtaR
LGVIPEKCWHHGDTGEARSVLSFIDSKSIYHRTNRTAVYLDSSTSMVIKTVLLVEDEVMLRINAADILRDAGLSVVEAASADEALRMLDAGMRVDAVFTDVNFTGLTDGIGLAWEISRRFPDAEILITSGAVRPDRKTIPPLSDFVAKPYSPDAVLRFFSAQTRSVSGPCHSQ